TRNGLVSRDLPEGQFVGVGKYRPRILASNRKGDLGHLRIASRDRYELLERADMPLRLPRYDHRGRLAWGQLALHDLAHCASAGSSPRGQREREIAVINDCKVMTAAFTEVHFAEIEFPFLHVDLTAGRNSGSPDTTLP